MMKITKKLIAWVLLISLSLFASAYAAEGDANYANKIENIDFSPLSGGRVSVRVRMKEPLANPPAGFTLNNPARIALDFPGTANGLDKNNISSGQGALKSVTLAQAKDRTRMVLNLTKAVGYNTTISGNDVIIALQGNEAAINEAASETHFAEPRAASSEQQHAISKVDFMRGKNGEGRVVVDLSDASTGINIKQKGKQIVVDFVNTDVPADLQRRLNVINFNTPVLYVDTMKQGKNGRMIIEPKGEWEQSAYQADNKFIIDVRQVIQDPDKLAKGKAAYSGEKLSLNFQNIEVRSVLQVIADFTGLNIITSDTVTGNITLRLKDVPWDQAMDIIMQNKGLTMRKKGNVILVAPTEEVAAKDKAALEASQAIADLEPIRTEVFTLKYQKAENFRNLLVGGSGGGSGTSGSTGASQSILSKRGSAVIDPRTNTLFIQDTEKKLSEIQEIINKIDIPVRQVMIESRLVLADDKFSKELGGKFGVGHSAKSDGGKNQLQIGGNLSATTTSSGVVNGTSAVNIVQPTGPVAQVSGNGGLNSNLPITGFSNFGSIAFSLFRLPAGLLLNLELEAMESDKRGKVVSSPRVTTANQKKAKIAQGTEIPYLQASSSGAANVAFKEAVLSLEVTPQITPDDKIIMDLEVKKESVGQIFSGVPSIDTQNVNTQVLVSNGETAVLGGIYEQTERNDVEKVPFFGDIPIVGNAFKHRTKTDNRTELLIFITPKIMDESLGLH